MILENIAYPLYRNLIMEVLPEIMSWLDSRMRVVKRNLKDLVEDPVGHTGKQVTNVMEDTATFIKDEGLRS